MNRRILVLMAMVSMIGAVGCGDCAGVGIEEIRPGTTRTLSIGESFTAEYWEGGTCAGSSDRHLEPQMVRWYTVDPTIVRVDSLSGVVRALASGDAHVWFRTPGTPAEPESRRGEILVHVR